MDNAFEIFFNYTRERYQIYLKRLAGLPAPWTDDPILQKYRFTNVFRELDRTTVWFRENIREPLRNDPRVLMAIIAFRWFNRINAGEGIKPLIFDNVWSYPIWRATLKQIKNRDGVIVTGAYMIKSPAVLDKIDGILENLFKAKEKEDELVHLIGQPYCNLQQAWEVLLDLDYVGQFTAHEIVVDLQHTFFLENASDIMSWTNPGPGCAAGIGMLIYGDRKKFDRNKKEDRKQMIAIMQQFLKASQDVKYWPKEWPQFDLPTIEFNFCEVDKYLRGKAGMRLKRRYTMS